MTYAMGYVIYERDDDPPLIPDDVRGFGPRILTLRRGMDGWWVLPRVTSPQGMLALSNVECVGKKAK